MTIPTRPAPAPPGPRGLNAAAGANASLEQLRMQFQEQHQQQHHHQSYQHNGGVQKLTIKLPPPPNSRNNGATPLANGLQQKSHNNNNNNQNSYNVNNNHGSSITRKFPHANVRYEPTTSWDGLPFEPSASLTTGNTNGSFKKVPPPRPPPPKVQFSCKKTAAPAPPQSVNILNNIFNRKKTVKAPAPSKTGRLTPAGVYGTSSGSYGTTSSSFSTTSQSNNSSYAGTSNLNSWGTSTAFSAYSSSTTTTTSTQQQEAQLISFDSPPSSPTFTQKSNSDCVSVDSFSSDSNFSSPNNGSVSQPESGFEDDFTARSRSTTSPLDPWETLNAFSNTTDVYGYGSTAATSIGTAPVRNLSTINTRIQSSNDNPLCNGKSLLPPTPSVTAPTIIKPKISQKPKAPKPPVLKQNIHNSNTLAYSTDDLPTPPSPPMPQCAPPPPPLKGVGASQISMLDVITGKADALQLGQSTTYELDESEPAYGYALYDFDGVEDGDLSFRENEKIYLLEQVSEEWYRGRTRSGCEGIFPSNYIDIRIPLAVPSNKMPGKAAMPASNIIQAAATVYEIPKVKCLYNFPAEVAGDLSLRENDMVTILYKINEDWLYGRIDGREGQFPANFLEYIPAHIPLP